MVCVLSVHVFYRCRVYMTCARYKERTNCPAKMYVNIKPQKKGNHKVHVTFRNEHDHAPDKPPLPLLNYVPPASARQRVAGLQSKSKSMQQVIKREKQQSTLKQQSTRAQQSTKVQQSAKLHQSTRAQQSTKAQYRHTEAQQSTRRSTETQRCSRLVTSHLKPLIPASALTRPTS